jgi:hypothetical protein
LFRFQVIALIGGLVVSHAAASQLSQRVECGIAHARDEVGPEIPDGQFVLCDWSLEDLDHCVLYDIFGKYVPIDVRASSQGVPRNAKHLFAVRCVDIKRLLSVFFVEHKDFVNLFFLRIYDGLSAYLSGETMNGEELFSVTLWLEPSAYGL